MCNMFKVTGIFIVNPFHATDLFWYPKVFWCFQEVSKEIIDMKWVGTLIISHIFFKFLLETVTGNHFFLQRLHIRKH